LYYILRLKLKRLDQFISNSIANIATIYSRVQVVGCAYNSTN
jgi:hypothetical protein